MTIFENKQKTLNKKVCTTKEVEYANRELKEIYMKCIRFCNKVPRGLYPFHSHFFINHYVKCYPYVTEPDLFNKDSSIFIVDSVISAREHCLDKSREFFHNAYLLGDQSIMLDYFKVLKFLKYEESVLIA